MKEALFIKKTIIEKLPNEWANTKLSCKWLNITYLCKNEEEENKQKQNSWYCGVNFYRRFVLDKTHNNNKQRKKRGRKRQTIHTTQSNCILPKPEHKF